MRTIRSQAVTGCVAALAVIAWLATPALAHISVKPDEAQKGGFADLTFHVPNEREDAATIRVDVEFPPNHPIADVSVKPHPGWNHTVARDGGAVTVTWEGGQIQPGHSEEFEVTVGPLPDDADQLVIRALQTYEGGEVVRWIDEPTDDGSEPGHPAPTLTLVAGGADPDAVEPDGAEGTEGTNGTDDGASDEVAHGDAHEEPAAEPADEPAPATTESTDESAASATTETENGSRLAFAGITAGLLALVAAVLAVRRTRST